MTVLEQRAIRLLVGVAYAPHSTHTRAAHALYKLFLDDPLWNLSAEQQANLWFLIWHYRRQVNDAEVVARADELVNGALHMEF